nr:hypothetical protein BaRGS_034688 [Batillaria attramentaria]
MSKLDAAELTKQPTDITECPYQPADIPALRPKEEEAGPQFFYDMSSKSEGGRGRKRHHQESGRHQGDNKQPRKPVEPTGPCWFCLGSPQVEKHLVVSVGTLTYLALAKGGLVADHVLILPIQHHQSTIVPAGAPYFYAELPTGERLLHRIAKRFPLQYGREVLAEPAILNMPERVDWRNCQADKDQEAQMAADFKSNFRTFDFNFL